MPNLAREGQDDIVRSCMQVWGAPLIEDEGRGKGTRGLTGPQSQIGTLTG